LRVVHLSTHKSLAEAVRFVTRDERAGKAPPYRVDPRTLGSCPMPASRSPRSIPHGGEGGLLGREEIEELAPAVVEARSRGLSTSSGPWPADSVFNRAIAGEFDVVLALYHDQGHIAIKVHDFHRSTTATLGIPFVRTSVDHGTAFDIAGQGRADPWSLESAVAAAAALIDGRLREL
jgi:4-phospho-D-threonate 3-dehydrogenase / 4-phospho-D-erythronate 3-dehydrogenase